MQGEFPVRIYVHPFRQIPVAGESHLQKKEKFQEFRPGRDRCNPAVISGGFQMNKKTLMIFTIILFSQTAVSQATKPQPVMAADEVFDTGSIQVSDIQIING